eukprot:Opistho-1_new@30037
MDAVHLKPLVLARDVLRAARRVSLRGREMLLYTLDNVAVGRRRPLRRSMLRHTGDRRAVGALRRQLRGHAVRRRRDDGHLHLWRSPRVVASLASVLRAGELLRRPLHLRVWRGAVGAGSHPHPHAHAHSRAVASVPAAVRRIRRRRHAVPHVRFAVDVLSPEALLLLLLLLLLEFLVLLLRAMVRMPLLVVGVWLRDGLHRGTIRLGLDPHHLRREAGVLRLPPFLHLSQPPPQVEVLAAQLHDAMQQIAHEIFARSAGRPRQIALAPGAGDRAVLGVVTRHHRRRRRLQHAHLQAASHVGADEDKLGHFADRVDEHVRVGLDPHVIAGVRHKAVRDLEFLHGREDVAVDGADALNVFGVVEEVRRLADEVVHVVAENPRGVRGRVREHAVQRVLRHKLALNLQRIAHVDDPLDAVDAAHGHNVV